METSLVCRKWRVEKEKKKKTCFLIGNHFTLIIGLISACWILLRYLKKTVAVTYNPVGKQRAEKKGPRADMDNLNKNLSDVDYIESSVDMDSSLSDKGTTGRLI